MMIVYTTQAGDEQAGDDLAAQIAASFAGERPDAVIVFASAKYRYDSLAEKLGSASFAGCNTHGQIARAPGQFGEFHNCTAVVCVLPE
jgi:hypothetical protein